MKKVMVLTAIMLFVAATSAFAFTLNPQHQYDNTSSFIVGSVTIGSGLLAANSSGPFTLTSGEKVKLDTQSSFTSVSNNGTQVLKVSDSTQQSTTGFVSFSGCINNCPGD